MLRNLRNFATATNEIHCIMKNLFIKSFLISVLIFLYSPFILAQDSENQEIIEVEYSSITEIDTLQVFMQNAQYNQAIEFINQKEPTKEFLYQKALCYRHLNNNLQAIEILKLLTEEYPDDISFMLQLAYCYEVLAKYSKSIECYDNMLAIDSTNTYFEVRKADLLYRAEKYSLALDAYNRIDLSYNPNYLTRCIAMCYEKLNQQELAKSYFSRAWELNEQDAYSANSLVKIQVKEENFTAAYVDSERFIKIDSTDATMNALNAFVYYNMDNYDTAIERFEKCVEQGDNSLLVNRSLGYSYFLTGKDSLALPFLQQAVLHDITNTNLLYILGKVNLKLGNYPEAVNCFRNLIEKITTPNILFYNAHKDLAQAYENNKDFRKAVGSYNNALRFTDNNDNKMELLYPAATIADKELKEYNYALYLYKQYQVCLFNYLNSLQDENDINETQSKLTALDEYINQLEAEVKKNNSR